MKIQIEVQHTTYSQSLIVFNSHLTHMVIFQTNLLNCAHNVNCKVVHSDDQNIIF